MPTAKFRLSDRQKLKLIDVVRHLSLTIVLPFALLSVCIWWLFVETSLVHYVMVFALVVLVNLAVRYGRQAVHYLRRMVQARKEASVRAIEEKKRKIVSETVSLSSFTSKNWARRPVDGTPVHIDEQRSWVELIMLFFNPYVSRNESSSGGRSNVTRSGEAAVEFFKKNAKLVRGLWLLGWLLVSLLTVATIIVPSTLDWFDLLVRSAVFAGLVMVLWTLIWGSWIAWLWPRDRLIVTELFVSVLSQRLPFQRDDQITIDLSRIDDVRVVISVPGKLLGYGHVEFFNTFDAAVLLRRKFVRRPKRVRDICVAYIHASKTELSDTEREDPLLF